MTAQRVILMVATGAAAYYAGFLAVLFMEAVGSGLAGMAGAHGTMPFDPAVESWWARRQSAIVFGFIAAAVVTALHAWIAVRRRDERHWRTGAAVALAIVAIQPLLQFTFLQQATVSRFNRGDASAVSALPNLGLHDQLPAVIARLRIGGPDAFQIAQSAMEFSGGAGEVRAVALDPAAPPDARFSAALALGGGRGNDSEVGRVLEEIVRDSDTNFRLSVPRRLKAAKARWVEIERERLDAIQRELLSDASWRVRRAALEDVGAWWNCDLMPAMANDPVAEIRALAFASLQSCHSSAPESDAVRAERVATYRTLLAHSDVEIRIRSGTALSKLGDAAGTDAAVQFVRGDPYGKDEKLLAAAIETIRRNLGERSAPMLWTISQCDRAYHPRGHYPAGRAAAERELDQMFGYGKWPPQYQRESTAPAAMLPEFCVATD